MNIVKLAAERSVGALPIPPEGQRPEGEPPVKQGFDNMNLTLCLARLPDPKNISATVGTGVAAIGATNVLALDNLSVNPIEWLPAAGNKLRFKLSATLKGNINKTLEQVLTDHNVVIFNRDIADVTYGGFLVMTIGLVGSGADIILDSTHFNNGWFLATIVRTSEEF